MTDNDTELAVVVDRVSISSPEFACRLWTILRPHLPSFPYPASVKLPATGARMAHSLNANIRLYKYTPSQHFNPHYDDSVHDTTGAVSEWTLLIYLTGVEDGVRGGEVGTTASTQGFRLAPCRLFFILIAKPKPRRPWSFH